MRRVSLAIGAAFLTLAATGGCQAEFRDAYLTGGEPAAPSPTQAAGPVVQMISVPSTAAPAAAAASDPATTASTASTGSSATTAAPGTPTPAAGPTTGSISGTVDVTPAILALNGTNVAVWIDNPPAQPAPGDHGATAVLDQKGMNFSPLLTIIRAGGKVSFQNADPFPHNIFSPDHEKFDLGTMPHGANIARQFDQPGHYALLCNLHTNMLAYVLVTPSGWFTQPDKDGKFTIAGVPNGTYTVKAWGGRLEEQAKQITVNGGDAAVSFTIRQAD